MDLQVRLVFNPLGYDITPYKGMGTRKFYSPCTDTLSGYASLLICHYILYSLVLCHLGWAQGMAVSRLVVGGVLVLLVCGDLVSL